MSGSSIVVVCIVSTDLICTVTFTVAMLRVR